MSQSARISAANIRLLVLDVDGVLTDGSLYLGDNGVEYKAFYSRDGHGIKLLMASGVQVAVITGRRSQVVADRMAALGVTHVYQGDDRKGPVFAALLRRWHLNPGKRRTWATIWWICRLWRVVVWQLRSPMLIRA